jgi:hypothetical protein
VLRWTQPENPRFSPVFCIARFASRSFWKQLHAITVFAPIRHSFQFLALHAHDFRATHLNQLALSR